MNYSSSKQNIYVRKLNGLGQRVTVQENLKVKQLIQIIKQLHSFQTIEFGQKDFNLVFKGKNITDKSQSTLKDLNIPSDSIVHLIFAPQQQRKGIFAQPFLSNLGLNQDDSISKVDSENQDEPRNSADSQTSNCSNKASQINVRVTFSGAEHQLVVNPHLSVQDLKKKIAIKLNLIHESLVLSHQGVQMASQKSLRDYSVVNQTLISLKFNLQKSQKKKLESRMVSSVTFSDENNQSNTNSMGQCMDTIDNKITLSSKCIDSEVEEKHTSNPTKRLSSFVENNKTNMYKSDINSFGSSGASKAALMFTNALHQKIVETESVVSGSFSEDTSMAGCDPNSIMITVKNQQQTKQFTFECTKTMQMVNIKEKILQVQKLPCPQKLQISLEEDLFQSIDLNKNGYVTLNQIVKKMGLQRAVFIYRVI